MDKAHVIIAIIAAFAGGEVTGMALILAGPRRRPPQPAPPGERQPQPGAEVIPLTRDRTRRAVTR